MKILLPLICLFYFSANAQINPQHITIARDSFGVPHIFAKTDAEVSYGLAWTHSEDDFKSIQMLALSGKGQLGKAFGKKGAQADYVVQLLRCQQAVDSGWHTLSPAFIQLITGYVEGLNAYAKKHPEELLVKNSFPVTVKEYMTAATLSLAIISGADNVLGKIFGGKITTIPGFAATASNSIAIHSSKTTNGETFLAINAHQPIEGPTAFYEAHLCSEEGWNILGGTFAGGPTIFHGVNENLGWAHTVNYQDKIDVFQLEINPANSNEYKFNDEWLQLETKKVKLKIKGIPFPVSKKAYWCKYGATVKTKNGVFAIRLAANQDIRGLEEWYRMNKAKNFTEFYAALSMTSLPMFNIMYADKFDTIFYVSNGKMPIRNPSPEYNWSSTVPGNTSKTLWTAFKPITALPQYINPKSGYLYNTNHSPFLATADADNLNPNAYDKNDGWERYKNNRSARFEELIQQYDKLSFDDLRKIKFDRQMPATYYYFFNVDSMLLLNATDYPDLATTIKEFQQWDRKATLDSKGAAIMLLVYNDAKKKLANEKYRPITTAESIYFLKNVQDYQLKHFGKTGVTLGELQKLVRGNKEEPLAGLPEVLAAVHTEPYKKGMLKMVSGDAYIELVRFPKNGLPIIETVNTFGASSKAGSAHYTDQMPLYLQQKTKHETLNKAEVLKTAEKIYHPGE